MMKTAITKIIDNIKVVQGFDSAVLDPETTKQKAAEELSKDEDFLSVVSQYNDYMEKKTQDYRDYYSRAKVDKTLRTKAAWELFLYEQDNTQVKLQKLAANIKEFRDSAFSNNLTYFEPKEGELVIDDSQFDTLSSAVKQLKQNEYIDLDLKKYEDNRGKAFFNKNGNDWNEERVNLFGEKKSDGSFYFDELNDSQISEIKDSKEKQRIRNLSDADRDNEIKHITAHYLREAAIKMNELEISGEINPKEKSKKWFDDQVKELTEKYKV